MVLSVSSAQAAAVSTAAPSKLSGYEAALRGATPAHTAMSSSAPSGNISNNVEFVANIPALVSAISIAFIGNDMFVSTVHGVYAYDISDVANPQLLGAIPMYIWENEHMAAGERGCAKRTVQERPPVLAAFSASHHHRVGNPEVPYLGNGSGWLKRSQRAAR